MDLKQATPRDTIDMSRQRVKIGAAPWHYVAYLLRVWWSDSGEQRRFRASIEDPHTGARHGFGSLEELLAYLATPVDDRQDDDATSSGG